VNNYFNESQKIFDMKRHLRVAERFVMVTYCVNNIVESFFMSCFFFLTTDKKEL
jgi:hypothetical protein